MPARARGLLDRGFHVFPADHPDHPQCIGKHGPNSPCDGQRGKHPAVKFSVWAVTVTPKMIDFEWAKHSGVANIAIACGPSGLVVIDEDEPGEVERWCDTYGITPPLPDTYTVTTGRGRHLYYRWDHTKQRIGNVPKAVDGFKMDVRGDGGCAIGEGSQHASGAVYTGNGQPIADLPPQVAEVLLAAGKHAQPEPDWDPPAGHHNTKIGFHHRHDALIEYAGRLRKSGLDRQEAEPVFRQRWLLCEQPQGQIPEARFHSPTCPYPVTWEEAQAKLSDVYQRYEAGKKLAGDNNGQTSRNLTVTAGSSVVARRIEWWEPDLIVASAINLLAAREGVGKSTVAASWAARETRNGGTVLWIGTEESREYAVVPRLIAAGADMDRILFVDVEISNTTGSITTTLQFPLDLPAIKQTIADHQVTMLVLDPSKGVVPPDFKGSDDVAVRQYLEPIAQLCSDCRVTLLGLTHFGKRDSSDSGLLILGSIAWSQVARSVVSIAEDSDSGTRVLTGTKANYATRTRSIEFAINSRVIGTADGPAEIGVVDWLGDTDKDARDLLGGSAGCGDDTSFEFDEHDYTEDLKASWLYQLLDDARKDNADVRPKDAAAVGFDKGVSRRSVFRLFDALANAGMAKSVDQKGFPRVTHWKLIDGGTTGTTGEEPGAREACEDPAEHSAHETVGTTGTTGLDLQKEDGTTGGTTGGGALQAMALQVALQEELPLTSENDAASAPVVPVVPTDLECAGEKPPIIGAPTASTPGYTDRVQQALAKARAAANACNICGQELIAPVSIEHGVCEHCSRASKGTDNTTTEVA